MDSSQHAHGEQKVLWNGHVGRAWAENQQILDYIWKPFEELLVEASSSAFGGRILDVGCGAGTTTLAIARRLGTSGYLVGIDISSPLIALARSRAVLESSSAQFVCADAQTHAFEKGSFNTIISRFGVMFFANPTIAFANLRRAAHHCAELRFIAWRCAEENPFMTTAERAAAPLFPDLRAPHRDAPGQFAFADRSRVRAILEQSGWAEIEFHPIDVTCTMPENQLVRYFANLGPVGLKLRDADEKTRNQVLECVRAAFNCYVFEDEVRFCAACWMVNARASKSADVTGSGCLNGGISRRSAY
jgi:ubiquinone/menaquinone biosynthesis C-methylase UbiE